MTPEMLLKALERAQAAVTTAPLRDGAVRAAQTAQAASRRSSRASLIYRVSNDDTSVTVRCSPGGKSAFVQAFNAQQASISREYQLRVSQALKP